MMDGSGSMFFGGGFMWIFWVLVLVAIVVVAKATMPSNARRNGTHEDSALSILDKRYARGEIGREEYQEKSASLKGDRWRVAYGATRSVEAGVALFLVSAIVIRVLVAAISRTCGRPCYCSFLGLFPIMFLSGTLAPVNGMPTLPQPLSLGSPLRHYMEVILGILLQGVGFGVSWPQAIAPTGIGAFPVGIAAAEFRREQP